jgi:predicted permease
MTSVRVLWSRVLGSVRWRSRERDIQDDVQAHLDLLAAEFEQNGMSAADARLAARREFGGVAAVQEQYREQRRLPGLDVLAQDVRYAIRTMAKAPGFTAVAVLTLALGIGANAAIFQVLYSLVIKPLPVRDPHQLVELQPYHDGDQQGFSYPLLREMIARQTSLEGIIASSHAQLVDVRVDGRPLMKPPQGLFANGAYFRALGAEPQIGRLFTESDDDPSSAPVAVISDAFWRRELNGHPDVLGTVITVRKTHIVVVGVTRPEFFGEIVGERPDVWIPLALVSQLQPGMPLDAHNVWIWPMARLRADVPMSRAQAELDALFNQLKPFTIRSKETKHYRLAVVAAPQGKGALHQEFGAALWILMAIVAILALIACCNLANLLLAKATARSHEIGVRLAVGASRGRLIRQLLTESVLLAILGCGLALALAQLTASALVGVATIGQDVILMVEPDWRVFVFTATVSFIAVLVFGLVPALAATRVGIRSILQGGHRTHTSSRSRHMTSNMFVVAQITLCLMLVAGASLLTRSFWKITTQDFGYRPDRVLTAYLHFDDSQQQLQKTLHSAPFRDALYQRVRAIPGIRNASLSMGGPLFFLSDTRQLALPNRRPHQGEEVSVVRVYPNYFDTMGIPILAGRPTTDDDRRGALRVAVISETTARTYFGSENPLGKTFAFREFDAARAIEIVGIARDVRYMEPREAFKSLVFVPMEQLNAFSVPEIVLNADGDPARFAEPVRQAVAELMPGLDVWGTKTLSETILIRLRRERLLAWLSTAFGVLALILACVGLYGVVSYRVALRTQEVGIRLALGASERGVRALLLREIVQMVGIGLVVGALATLALAGVLNAMLFELSPRDPATLMAAATVLTGVALLAGFMPARRASRPNPMATLRRE